MPVLNENLAWLAGIVDGEGCLAVKRQIRRKTGPRMGQMTGHQLWLVLCNTSEPMMRRVLEILAAIGVEHPKMRRVWKGERATRYQWWLHVARKHELLKLIMALKPYLVAKKDEAVVFEWYLQKSCSEKLYHPTALDLAMLESLSEVKRHGGEAPARIKKMWSEVIPSQAVPGHRAVSGVGAEGVETRSVTPKNNPIHECPAALRLVQSR